MKYKHACAKDWKKIHKYDHNCVVGCGGIFFSSSYQSFCDAVEGYSATETFEKNSKTPFSEVL